MNELTSEGGKFHAKKIQTFGRRNNMENRIDLGKLAPEQNLTYLTTSPFLIDDEFIPSLRTELGKAIEVDEKIWLDFKAFGNKSFHSLQIMESILQLLKELNILDRTIFVDMPVTYYEYLNELMGENLNMTIALRNII